MNKNQLKNCSMEFNVLNYQFHSNVALSLYLSKHDLPLSKLETRVIYAFQKLFTEYMLATSDIDSARISAAITQLAMEINIKKESYTNHSDDLNEYDPCSKMAENLRKYRFIATGALSYYLMNNFHDLSKIGKKFIMEMHQTWVDYMMDIIQSYPDLITKVVAQLTKEIKKI